MAMNVRVSKALFQSAGVWAKDSEHDRRFDSYSRYTGDEEKFTLDIQLLAQKELVKLEKATDGKPEWRGLNGKIKTYFRLKVNPEGTVISHLERLEPALKAFMLKTPSKWLFQESEDGAMLPYYVVKSEFVKARRERYGDVTPAHVLVELASSGGGRRITYWREDLQGFSIPQLLEKSGWFAENKELVAQYQEEIQTYLAEKGMTGKQFLAVGQGFVESTSWYRNSERMAMERDGRASKVVMDHEYKKAETKKSDRDDDDDDDKTASTEYWLTVQERQQREAILKSEDEDAEAKAEELVPLKTTPPLHPYVNVFDLKEHDFVRIHINNLKPYQYDETVNDKLVLPKAKKDLIGVLIQGANFLMEDIIQGKTGGIIVLATGIPGTGKTLTAEVYAETIKKPLYTVQCSQLGTSAGNIENQLQKILSRATRWGAILLIDEADVYVRERGDDIEQNAIVGVFLRVLEYYRGVLFMTSNRATILDDAVMSRATAHIVYETPSEGERARIWEVLSKQFGLKLVGRFDQYAAEFGEITGRTIKNLLKLSMLLAQREKRQIDLKLVQQASEFIDGAVKARLKIRRD
jgi:hypothetical protein